MTPDVVRFKSWLDNLKTILHYFLLWRKVNNTIQQHKHFTHYLNIRILLNLSNLDSVVVCKAVCDTMGYQYWRIDAEIPTHLHEYKSNYRADNFFSQTNKFHSCGVVIRKATQHVNLYCISGSIASNDLGLSNYWMYANVKLNIKNINCNLQKLKVVLVSQHPVHLEFKDVPHHLAM